jgi:hypothetical protein
VSLGFALSTGLFCSTTQTSAQPLVKDAPTGNLIEEVDISINPEEPLRANGKVSISTEGATDQTWTHFRMKGLPSLYQVIPL